MSKARKKQSTASPPHLKTRIRTLQTRLAQHNVDALLLTNPRDIRYLTGFIGDDSWALIRQRNAKPHILSDFRFQEQIAREAPHATAIMRKRSLTEELKNLAERLHLEKIGLQAQHVSLTQRRAIAKSLGARRLAELDDSLLQQRAVKDKREINTIRKALRIQETALSDMLEMGFLQPGTPERHIAAFIEYHMRIHGAEARSFPTIAAVDTNASLPHAIPGNRTLKRGSTLLIDWGARVDGYCSDLTRVLALGKMKPKIREIYQIVLEAQQAGIQAVRPGAAMRDVDEAARKIIRDAGYGDRFGHSLGHGLGMDVHEQPTLSPRSQGELKPGHVVTVEPGIYLPGVGGVRIEDDVAVTTTGRTILSRLPKSLESAIISES